MPINGLTLDAYRRYRRENPYTPASQALARAKQETTEPTWAESFRYVSNGSFDEPYGTIDGFDVTIRTVPDEDADISWLGEFTDTADDDTVPNPEYQHGRYKYFRVENIQDWRDYWRQGMSKSAARQAVREAMAQDAATALQEQYGVIVTVSRDDVELGEASLWGCYVDSYGSAMWVADENGLIDTAMAEAKKTLGRLCRAETS